ncbi:MAG: hypothetical protein J6D06_08775 [Clostridia bacterium]|nr:hypothetical protein [Clostridia bacterium]
MKKHLVIISILMLSGIALMITISNKGTIKRTATTPTSITSETQMNYVLKDYNGRIALFYENQEKPLQIYNVFTDSLPYNDAKLLEKGITVKSNELNDVLSDYIS